MKIIFGQKYKSIENFNDVEVNDSSIFLGVNGAGKTHLLKAIHEGFVTVDGISKGSISYFNLQTFLIRNQKNITPGGIDEEKQQAWNILDREKATLQGYDQAIKAITEKDFLPYSCSVLPAQEAAYRQQIKKIKDRINRRVRDKPKIRQLLVTAIFESGKYASELSQGDFFKFSNYNPSDYELLESLSEVFIDYQKRVIISDLPKDKGGLGLTKGKIKELFEKSPWNFMNRMFEEFNLNHKITGPEFRAGDLINSHAIPFQVKLAINGSSEEEIDFEDLSSGEKILCALAITVYQDKKSKFPELLLLDEIDASLHPAMIKNLLDVIEKVFRGNGCKVILATHSPTTVAFSPDESLFEVKKGNPLEKIIKVSQSKAINILSEGIMTLEKGLNIYDQVDSSKKLQIITEGKNTKHIEKAIEILEGYLKNEVQIISGAEGRSGCQQLKNAFDVMSNAKFSDKFLFVWDCDYAGTVSKLSETENFKVMYFEENTSNTIARDNSIAKGIENLYPDQLFDDDVYSTKRIGIRFGGSVHKKEFDKNKFLEKIKKKSDPKLFKNFQPLIEKIKGVLA